MIGYLVTDSLDIGRIQREGFTVGQQLPNVCFLAHPDVIIITTNKEMAWQDANEWGTGVFEVDLEALNKADLFPTPKFLAANGMSNTFESYRLELPFRVVPIISQERDEMKRMQLLGCWYGDNYERFKPRWKRSIDWGEVGHRGTIPAKALKFVAPSKFPQPVMYHGTTTTAAKIILREGLKAKPVSPRRVGDWTNWNDLVYLTSSLDYALGGALNRAMLGVEGETGAILEVDMTDLDTSLCYPDEEYIAENFYFYDEMPSTLIDELRSDPMAFKRICDWICQQPKEQWQHYWPGSLSVGGNVAYAGCFPPERIRLVQDDLVVPTNEIVGIAEASAAEYNKLR